MRRTIYAPLTPAARSAIAAIRLSGPSAGAALQALTGATLPAPRRATLAALTDPATAEPLDRAIVLWFPAPASLTGEDVAELHLHGGRAVMAGVIAALERLDDLRPAEPGEFARRAFLNGKLDLTGAEAIADLVDAETTAQRRQALTQLDGALGHLYEDWRSRLLRALAYLEAALDFPDEDLPADLAARAREPLVAIAAEIARHLADDHRGERLRDGLSVAILGAPNAGKSSLLNALARRDVAIVSARAGTTRDVIEVHLELGGYPVVLADTAGLREADDEVEAEGIRRALARAARADLKLVLVEAPAWPTIEPTVARAIDDDSIVVITKSDLHPIAAPLAVSAVTGAGLDALLARLIAEAERRLAPGAAPALTRARHRTALTDAQSALERALTQSAPELLAEDVRLATRTLGRITGRVDVEDMLDLIFAEFCIGK